MKNKMFSAHPFYVKKLRSLRINNFITQKNMAIKLKVSQPAYAKLENGKTKLTNTKVEKICKIFKIPVHDFLTIKDSSTKEKKKASDSLSVKILKKHYEDQLLIKDIRIGDLEMENIKLRTMVKFQKNKIKFL